ncbi:hypothetical protein Btru_028664 [Bulinus truncatus]|nr:hypothetical protein Btru_028664 [Bulinus truncatus]
MSFILYLSIIKLIILLPVDCLKRGPKVHSPALCSNPKRFQRVITSNMVFMQPKFRMECPDMVLMVDVVGMINFSTLPECLRNVSVFFYGKTAQEPDMRKLFCKWTKHPFDLISNDLHRPIPVIIAYKEQADSVYTFNCSLQPAHLHGYSIYMTLGDFFGVTKSYFFNQHRKSEQPLFCNRTAAAVESYGVVTFVPFKALFTMGLSSVLFLIV